MTKIERQTAFRQSQTMERDRGEMRPILVALEPTAIVLRLKGLREQHRLTYSRLYALCAEIEAEQNRRHGRRRLVPRGLVGTNTFH